jgi:hypothetical protein
MKQKILLLITLCCSLLSGCSKRLSNEIDIVSSSVIDAGSYQAYSVDIVLNTNRLDDYEACAENIIYLIINDKLDTIKFSWNERPLPTTLKANVYLTEKDREKNKRLFTATYKSNNKENSNTDNIMGKYTVSIENG